MIGRIRGRGEGGRRLDGGVSSGLATARWLARQRATHQFQRVSFARSGDSRLFHVQPEIIRQMQTIGRARAAAVCVLVILLAATTACKNSRAKVAEYEVLSAFIDAKFASRKGVDPLEPTGDGVTRIVIHNMTKSDEEGINCLRMDGNGQPIPWAQTANSLQSEAPSLKRATVDAFREVNGQQATLHRSFHIAFDYELVDSTQLDSVFKNGNWPAYYKRFPGSPGILGFSRVGFNADGTQALFFASVSCGGLCGGGAYVVMERRDGHWVIEKEIEAWIS